MYDLMEILRLCLAVIESLPCPNADSDLDRGLQVYHVVVVWLSAKPRWWDCLHQSHYRQADFPLSSLKGSEWGGAAEVACASCHVGKVHAAPGLRSLESGDLG